MGLFAGGMHWICDHSAGTIRCNSITLWHLSSIDHGSDVCVDTSTTEEMKYFMITELIRERIMHAFPEVQESYADELTENFYNELFS